MDNQFDPRKFSKEQLQQAVACETPEELLDLAKKNGIEISDVVSIYLYTDEYVPSVGDMVVRGIVDFEFNNTSQKTISESMKEFREMFSEFAVVKSVSDYKFGGLPHIEITAR